MTITEFLTARYDEEEAIAREALEEGGSYDDAEIPWAGRAGDDNYSREHNYGASWVELRVARVLADIAAKRAIVALYESSGLRIAMGQVVRLLAQPYAEHPDFDPAWRTNGG